MTILADVHAYWASSSLNAALPASKVYSGQVPESITFPYAVITILGLQPTPTVGNPYYETFSFQISIFDSDPDNADLLGNTIAGKFDYKKISAATISCERTNGPIFMEDSDTPAKVYHVYIVYDLLTNKTLPDN